MLANMNLWVSAELKRRICEAAEVDDVPINEFVARVMADHFGDPDLAVIPRKRMGRRPWKEVAR